MARLKIPIEDDDDSLPELEDLLKRPGKASEKRLDGSLGTNSNRTAKNALNTSRTPRISRPSGYEVVENLKPKQKTDGKQGGIKKQRALRKIADNSVLLRPLEVPLEETRNPRKLQSPRKPDIKPKEAKLVPQRIGKLTEVPKEVDESLYEEAETTSEDDEDESIVIPRRMKPAQRVDSGTPPESATHRDGQVLTKPCIPPPSDVVGGAEDRKLCHHQTAVPAPVSRPSSSDQDRAAFLIYNPTRTVSPHKAPPVFTPSTPPPNRSVTISRPQSPFKARIPPTPQRPDLDDFWSQEVVNEWNDQYSPKKALTSPRKKRSQKPSSGGESDFACPSPTASPRKSPVKKTTEERATKKAFETRKQQLAEEFLEELDRKITHGQISELAQKTGGVKLIWSKKLNSTAGRANWRREAIIKKFSDGAVDKAFTHHANIELAEKVIDDEDRLINVLAHEFCHLANFMISGVKDNPHGKEFKEWAKKCSAVFGSRGVVVTTKHSYAIDYKYVWECTGCAIEFKRHSKSIDPAKHTCGACKSKLVQTKPTIRKNAKVSDYQLFVKENFQRVKKESASASHGAVMEAIGRLYREQKAEKLAETQANTMTELVQALDIATPEG